MYIVFFIIIFVTNFSVAQTWTSSVESVKKILSNATIGHPSGGGTTNIKDLLTIDSTVTFNVGSGGLTIQDGTEISLPAWIAWDANGKNIAFTDGSNIFFNFGVNGWQARAALVCLDDNEIRFGSSNNFRFEYKSGSGYFAISDAANNELVTITDDGSTGTLDVIGDIDVTGNVKKGGTNYTHPDYVFEPDYDLMSLPKLRKYIKKNKCLPGVVSAKQIEKQGFVSIDELARVNLEKIEELTLYILQIHEENKKLKKIVKKLEKEID